MLHKMGHLLVLLAFIISLAVGLAFGQYCYNEGKKIAADPSGNIYVTGRILNKIGTIKYSPSGQQFWTNIYSEAASGYARDIAVANGKVFICGSAYISDVGYAYVTIAYDIETGQQLWVAKVLPQSGSYYYLQAMTMAVDNGYVYVTGYADGTGTSYDYLTVAYSAETGSQLWRSIYNGSGTYPSDYPTAIAAQNGKVFVTGYSYISTSSYADYATVAYDGLTGTQTWVTIYNGPHSGYDHATAIAVENGLVYVT